jgi:hypothetical protein
MPLRFCHAGDFRLDEDRYSADNAPVRFPAHRTLNMVPPVVLGVGVELAAGIFPAALPLAIGSAANKLAGMITGKMKQLLA